MKLLRTIGLAAVMAVLMTGPAVAAQTGTSLVKSEPAAAAPLAASGACATGIGGGGGQGIICEVTIVNTITSTGGSAVVTVHQCLGSAGAPLSGVCTTVTSTKSAPVTAVTQCDGSVLGGGATLRCSVVITNNFVDLSPGSSAVTVNQCVGSGATTGCNPFPATTTSAAITQCNGSANGGGVVELTCTATGTMATALPITIDQCNGSANGGGSLVICSARMVNNAVTLTSSPSSTPPGTSTVSDAPSNGGSPTPLILLGILLALSGLGLAAVEAQRRSIRS